MKTFSGLLCTGEFPAQRSVTLSFDFFSLICAWINSWVNNREAGDLRHHRANYDVSAMRCFFPWTFFENTGLNSLPWSPCISLTFPTKVFCMGVSGFLTGCPWHVWCRSLTYCRLHVGPIFGKCILSELVGKFYGVENSLSLSCEYIDSDYSCILPPKYFSLFYFHFHLLTRVLYISISHRHFFF